MSNHKGESFATNEYYTNMFNVSERTVRNWLQKLKDGGYITTTENRYKNGTTYKTIRCIQLTDKTMQLIN